MKQESPFQVRIDTGDTMRTRWHRGSKTRSTGSLPAAIAPCGGVELL